MTDSVPVARSHEDRVLPAIVYGLYVFGAMSMLITVIIGLVIAYANRATAGPRMDTHYRFLIHTFCKTIWWFLIGIGVGLAGLVMTITLILAPIGIPLMIVGWGGAGLVGVWFYVRCVVGIIYLVQDEPYPRPEAWLI
jgi:uncharacterized membrane protein